jgi:predicted enzyme related to lactoylglutathione lyase
MEKITDMMKRATKSSATTKEEPVKYNITVSELEKMLELAKKNGWGITMKIQKTGIGSIFEISEDYDGEFEDITNYSAF